MMKPKSFVGALVAGSLTAATKAQEFEQTSYDHGNAIILAAGAAAEYMFPAFEPDFMQAFTAGSAACFVRDYAKRNWFKFS